MTTYPVVKTYGMTFQQKLVKSRNSLGWSQNRLAQEFLNYPEVSVSKSKVSDWEVGRYQPNLKEIAVLSRIFGVAPQYWILDDLEDPNAPHLTKEQEIVLRVVKAAKLTTDELMELLIHGRQVESPTVETREVKPPGLTMGPKKPPRKG